MYEKYFADLYIKSGFSKEEAIAEISFVCDILFGLTSKDLILGKSLTSEQNNVLQKIIKERVLTKRPIQQLTGCAFFMSEKYKVNEYTLIPRPETEILVLEALKIIKAEKFKNVCDIGTGSGCIAISVVENSKNLSADAVDISENAINIAKENAILHGVSDKINFIKSDLFENVNEKYDIIISNPPYIPYSEKANLQTEVVKFEPESALFAEDNGIYYYGEIIGHAGKYLNPGGYLIFELGINQSGIVREIFKEYGFKNIEITKDLNNIDRVISARI